MFSGVLWTFMPYYLLVKILQLKIYYLAILILIFEQLTVHVYRSYTLTHQWNSLSQKKLKSISPKFLLFCANAAFVQECWSIIQQPTQHRHRNRNQSPLLSNEPPLALAPVPLRSHTTHLSLPLSTGVRGNAIRAPAATAVGRARSRVTVVAEATGVPPGTTCVFPTAPSDHSV